MDDDGPKQRSRLVLAESSDQLLPPPTVDEHEYNHGQ